MRVLAFMMVAAAALFAASGDQASAQPYYGGPGVGVYVGPAPGYYEERRYRRRHYDDRYDRRYERRRGYYDNRTGQTYYRPRAGRCPPRYTVQDGICKPYRGY